MTDNETLDMREIAAMLHVTLKALRNRYYANPCTLPPPIKLPGQSRPIWFREDVMQWLRDHQQAR